MWRCHVVIVTYWDWYLANSHVNRNSELKNTVRLFSQVANCCVWRLHDLVDGDSQVFYGLTQCRLLSSFEHSKAVSSSRISLVGLLADLQGRHCFLSNISLFATRHGVTDVILHVSRYYDDRLTDVTFSECSVCHFVAECVHRPVLSTNIWSVSLKLQLICHLRQSTTPSSLQHLYMNMK